MVVFKDVDKFLTSKDFNLRDMKWPWNWTHFILRKKCFNCRYPTLSILPPHFVIGRENIEVLQQFTFILCQNCKEYLIYDHIIEDECEYYPSIMPYKIVKTTKDSKLVIVPSGWEVNGILRWPKYSANKLIREEDSLPEENWKKISCTVKRYDLINFLKAEQELDKMCDQSETETDTEQNINSVPYQKNITFEEIVQDCILENDALYETVEIRHLENSPTTIHPPANNTHFKAQQYVTQPGTTKGENLENALILIQPPAVNNDSNPQQNATTEVQIDNASLTLMVLAKIETLQENNKILTEKINENIKAQQEDRKFLNESVQSIFLGLSNISVQFDHVMNEVKRVENDKEKPRIQKIESETDLNNFEKELEKPEVVREWRNNYSIIFGKGKGRGVNNAYALVDLMFNRCFLLQCSWAGGSRTTEQKICFKSHTKIINFFFDIIHESDSSYTLLDCHKFFKNVLKNSRQRNESKQERTSRTKNRPKLRATRTNLCNENQPSSSIAGTSAPENHSYASQPVAAGSGSGPENRTHVSLPVAAGSGSGPENRSQVLSSENADLMSSASAAIIPTERLETFV